MKINFDKIRNYNQLMLSVAATIGVIMLLFGCTVFMVETTYWMRNNDERNEGILARQGTKQLLKDTLRKQIISFKSIQIIDSINQIFILPVTQADLANTEDTDDLLGLTNAYTSNYRYYDSPVHYNNLLLYYAKNAKSEVLFDDRVCISNYFSKNINNQNYLIIVASNADSNKDKYINQNDLQETYVYNIENRSLNKFKLNPSFTALKIFQPRKSNYIIGKFGIDRNQNGEFDENVEPIVFHQLNIENLEMTSIAKQEQINSLQKLLEGR